VTPVPRIGPGARASGYREGLAVEHQLDVLGVGLQAAVGMADVGERHVVAALRCEGSSVVGGRESPRAVCKSASDVARIPAFPI